MMQNIKQALGKYWGYDSFLPLQKQAMECISRGQDSIVVLPTGGGKSLCFQAPAVTMPGLAIVVSPLISLMKDQVDALAECGFPARRFAGLELMGNGTVKVSKQERRQYYSQMKNSRKFKKAKQMLRNLLTLEILYQNIKKLCLIRLPRVLFATRCVR